MQRLEVQSSRAHAVVGVLLGVFMVPMALFNIFGALTARPGNGLMPFLVGTLMLACYAFVYWAGRRAELRSVRIFTEEGISRNDGRTFTWSELSKVVHQVRVRPPRAKRLWRTEIHFKNGDSAWVVPRKVANFPEVNALVHQLPCEHTEVRV